MNCAAPNKFVQDIKLAIQECGPGAECVRAPRLLLKGEEREEISRIVHRGFRADRALRIR